MMSKAWHKIEELAKPGLLRLKKYSRFSVLHFIYWKFSFSCQNNHKSEYTNPGIQPL